MLPKSKRHISAWGLFVALSPAINISKIESALYKYKKQGKIYLPLNAELYPKLTEEELKKVPLYAFQVFHPTIGLVGFDGKEALGFSDLINFENKLVSNWRSLEPKYVPPAKLQFISIVQPNQEDLLEELSKQIGNKPLDELTKDQPKDNA